MLAPQRTAPNPATLSLLRPPSAKYLYATTLVRIFDEGHLVLGSDPPTSAPVPGPPRSLLHVEDPLLEIADGGPRRARSTSCYTLDP